MPLNQEDFLYFEPPWGTCDGSDPSATGDVSTTVYHGTNSGCYAFQLIDQPPADDDTADDDSADDDVTDDDDDTGIPNVDHTIYPVVLAQGETLSVVPPDEVVDGFYLSQVDGMFIIQCWEGCYIVYGSTTIYLKPSLGGEVPLNEADFLYYEPPWGTCDGTSPTGGSDISTGVFHGVKSDCYAFQFFDVVPTDDDTSADDDTTADDDSADDDTMDDDTTL
jgi:hypothetical protein